MHFTLGVTRDHQRHASQFGGDKIASVGHLTVVTDKLPGIGKQILHFQFEHFRTDIEIAMDLVVLYQRGHGIGIIQVSRHQQELL